MISKEPDLDWKRSLGGGLIYLGLLLFLVALHILTINSNGGTEDVLNVVFIVFVAIYVAALILGGAGTLIQILRYITWQITTPTWMKKKQRGNLK